MCLLANNEVECRVVWGNDSANCGGCDWKCPYKTHCSSGGCVCDDHRCGNTCLNLRNNPRNCGACGNVCASGFCYQGRCYESPEEPAVCITGEAFRNGRFLNGNRTGWSAAPGPLSTGQMQFDVAFAVPDPTKSLRDGYITQITPIQSGSYMSGSKVQVDLSSQVRLCPGVAYDLNVMVRMDSNTLLWLCSYEAVVGGRVIPLESRNPPEVPGGGGYTRLLGNKGPIGPLQFGEAGTYTTNKVYLGAEFRLRTTCASGARSQGIWLWGFTMYPV
jgi:hypothetical protein